MARSGVTIRIRDVDRGWKKLQKRLRNSRKPNVRVGFSGQKIATKAAYNEFGTDSIPARPFMGEAFDQNVDDLADHIRDGVEEFALGRRDLDQVLQSAGERHKRQIEKSLDNPPGPALDEDTAEEKGHSKPLLHTGELRASVKVKLRKGRAGDEGGA